METSLIQNSSQFELVDFSTELFKRYIDYTDVKGITLKGYATGIRAFAHWMQENGIIHPIREDIKSYKAYLESGNFTAGTRAQYLRIVKHFFRWTASEGLYPNIADNIKGAKVRADNTKRDAFGDSDIEIILESIPRDTVTGKRDFAMILLSVTCGLRIIEMNRANIEDIQTLRGEPVIYIQGKGHDSKDAYKKLVQEVVDAIREYLETRPEARKSDPLFIGTSNRAKGVRLSEPSISTVIKDRFIAAGYDTSKLTAHSLRHTGVTLLLKANGGNLQQAQQYARHSGMNTTLIYSHNIDRDKDHSEQMVYDYIFNHGQKTTAQEAAEMLQELTAEQAADVLQYIKSIKERTGKEPETAQVIA